MLSLHSVSKPVSSPLESAREGAMAPLRSVIGGARGALPSDVSRAERYLVAKGRGGSLRVRSVIGGIESVLLPTDDRVRVLETELTPWRMICSLRMRGPAGPVAVGTGWFVGPRTLLTAGHCVHSKDFFGGWASSIEIVPGRNGSEQPFGKVTSATFSSVDRWVQNADPDFDIGCIHLPSPPAGEKALGETLGWFGLGALPPEELRGYLVNVSGYPIDRGNGEELYHHRNRVLRVTERRVFYDVDTFGGQSGAPVWIHEAPDSLPLVVGIHAYGVGGSPQGLVANSAPRILPEVLEQIRKWVDGDGGYPPGS